MVKVGTGCLKGCEGEGKKRGAGNFPAPFVHTALLRAVPAAIHVVENPVPDDEEPGDYHVGEEAGAEECPREDKFVVHHPHLQPRAGTVSAQVSTRLRMASSENEVRATCSRLKLTK